jgi:PTS system mannose-specific IIB component
MTVTLFRVDDRVIHGQTITRWSVTRPVYGILVVGDNIASDNLRMRVLKAAAGNKKVGIYTEEQGISKVKQAIESDRNYYVICETPVVFEKLHKAGVNIEDFINVGPMSSGKEKNNVARNVSIGEEEYNAFDYLSKQGIDIQFQLIPSDDITTWDTVKKKYDSI